MKSVLLAFMGLSGGVTIGSAAAAFISLLDFVPRLLDVTKTKRHIGFFQNVIVLGATFCSFMYFFNLNIKLHRLFSIVVSLSIGMFIGLFSSALAEVLNVMPVFSKKFKLKDRLVYIVVSLLIGKVAGSLWYWLAFIKR